MKFAEFDQYSEDLLMAQYDVSEIITHEPMKGEIREDFLVTARGVRSPLIQELFSMMRGLWLPANQAPAS